MWRGTGESFELVSSAPPSCKYSTHAALHGADEPHQCWTASPGPRGEASISRKLVTTSHFSSVTTNICLLAISVRLNSLMVIPRGYSLFPNLTVISAPVAAQAFDQHILASVVRRLNTVLWIMFNCLMPLNDCLYFSPLSWKPPNWKSTSLSLWQDNKTP